jgi:prevent-host-death family protein
MRTTTLANAKAKLGAYVDECESEGPVVITRNGKPVAVLVAAMGQDDMERFVLAHSPRFQAMLGRSRKSIEEGRGLTHQEFWAAAKKRAEERKKSAGNRKTKS